MIAASGSASTRTSDLYSPIVLKLLARRGCPSIRSMTESMIAAYLGEFAPRGSAKVLYMKAFRSFFSWALRHRLIEEDPVAGIPIRKPRRAPPVVLTADELNSLVDAARRLQGERVAWAIRLIFLLGLRRMEASGLRWADIRAGTDGPVIEISRTKGSDSRPALPLEEPELECLAHLRDLPAAPQASLGKEFILRARPATISRWVLRAGQAADLHPRKTKAHRLRATRATNMLRDGVDVRVVQQFLGHLRLESTAWYLAHPEESEIRAGMRRSGWPEAI
jgi:integrase/recombinase XerD